MTTRIGSCLAATLVVLAGCSVAVEYLASTKMPVEEIGHRVGFREPSNFRKAFRR